MFTMVRELHVLSIYEGFFAGGARALHTDVVIGLHGRGGQVHSVLSMHREMHRETLVQRMDEDARYHSLTGAGVPVTSLGRSWGVGSDPAAFTDAELTTAAAHAVRADIILSLKEQPFHLMNRPGFPRTPVIVCLHRSDPENQGSALSELRAAVVDGRVVAGICCAESTRAAYEAAGVPAGLLHVIPNGVDLTRFRPVSPRRRASLRRSLGVPAGAGVVVLAARYAPMKDVALFLRAAREYLERDPAGYILMCGAGMSLTNPELCVDIDAAFADEPRLLQRLYLLGVRQDMEAIYAAADVVALTSAVGEAAPLCLIEGAMCGAIPVATDVGDCAAIVAGLGFITAPEAGAIGAAWSEAIERRADLLGALEASRPRFSLTRMVAAYAALIHRTYRDLDTASRRAC